MSAELNSIVTQRIEVAPGLIILRVVPDDWQMGDFRPGQFAVLGLPGSAPRCRVSEPEDVPPAGDKIIKRAYSIASSSLMKEYLEFYIVMVPSGALTPRLFALRTGDRVWLSAKFSGLFTLDDVPEHKHVVFVATGTGLAPYISMLRTHLVCGGTRRLAVIHGARHSWDLGYRAELATLDNSCTNFTYVPSISRPAEEPAGWRGAAGHIQDVWKSMPLAGAWGFRPSPDDTHVFLCGNPAMIESMVKVLEREGFKENKRKEPGQIHVERYW